MFLNSDVSEIESFYNSSSDESFAIDFDSEKVDKQVDKSNDDSFEKSNDVKFFNNAIKGSAFFSTILVSEDMMFLLSNGVIISFKLLFRRGNSFIYFPKLLLISNILNVCYREPFLPF